MKQSGANCLVILIPRSPPFTRFSERICMAFSCCPVGPFNALLWSGLVVTRPSIRQEGAITSHCWQKQTEQKVGCCRC